MHVAARAWSISLVLLCLAGPVGAQGQLPELTTDSLAYCDRLHERLLMVFHDANPAPPREVVDLSAKGHRMCHDGHIRGGIQRLRHALVIMQQHLAAP